MKVDEDSESFVETVGHGCFISGTEGLTALHILKAHELVYKEFDVVLLDGSTRQMVHVPSVEGIDVALVRLTDTNNPVKYYVPIIEPPEHMVGVDVFLASTQPAIRKHLVEELKAAGSRPSCAVEPGHIIYVFGKYAQYTCNTFSGCSGSPVVVKTGDGPRLLLVHNDSLTELQYSLPKKKAKISEFREEMTESMKAMLESSGSGNALGTFASLYKGVE